MVAVVVHQVVAITAELVAEFFDDPADLLGCEVCAADLYALPEAELFAQFVVVAGLDLEDSGEGEGVAAVRVLDAEDLHARVEHPQADGRCVIVDPVLQVDEEMHVNFVYKRISGVIRVAADRFVSVKHLEKVRRSRRRTVGT